MAGVFAVRAACDSVVQVLRSTCLRPGSPLAAAALIACALEVPLLLLH